MEWGGTNKREMKKTIDHCRCERSEAAPRPVGEPAPKNEEMASLRYALGRLAEERRLAITVSSSKKCAERCGFTRNESVVFR